MYVLSFPIHSFFLLLYYPTTPLITISNRVLLPLYLTPFTHILFPIHLFFTYCSFFLSLHSLASSNLPLTSLAPLYSSQPFIPFLLSTQFQTLSFPSPSLHPPPSLPSFPSLFSTPFHYSFPPYHFLTIPLPNSFPSTVVQFTWYRGLCQGVMWHPVTIHVPSDPVTMVVCVTPMVPPTPVAAL